MDTPALILGGNVPALGVVRGLGERGIPVALFYYNDHDMAQASRHVRQSARIPDPIADERAFVERTLALGRPFRGALLVPTSDEALGAVSRYKAELGGQFVVGCPDWGTVSSCLDKALTYRLALDRGLPVPGTLVPRTLEEAIDGSGALGFPLLLKPAESHLYYRAFHRKMAQVGDLDQLRRGYLEAEGAGLEVMLQEIIPGPDDQVVNFNAYCWDGRVLVEFTARQLRKAPPRFGSPRVLVSELIPEAMGPGRDILAALGYCGFANVELKRDARDGTFKLMEINARHNMSSLLAVRCGVNFPLIEYRHRIRGELPGRLRQREGMYWCNNLQDMAYSLRSFREEGLSIATYARPYLRPHCDAIFDRHDLGPFAARISYLAKRALWTGRRTVARLVTGPRLRSRARRSPGVSAVVETRTVGGLLHGAMLRCQPRRSLPFTQFLRAPAQFDALVGPVLEFLHRGRDLPNLDIAVWGCSNGAEPYSIASVLLSRCPGLDFSIRAYDIDEQLLERARTGIYTPEEVFENPTLAPAFVEETFLVSGGAYRVRPEISRRVRFERADILTLGPPGRVGPSDITFAQNMLFHLNPSQATRAFDNICGRLRSRAALFVDGMDLVLRTTLTVQRGLEPLDYRIEDIHNEALRTRGDAWPLRYWGLEPLSIAREDWKQRYCTIFLKTDNT